MLSAWPGKTPQTSPPKPRKSSFNRDKDYRLRIILLAAALGICLQFTSILTGWRLLKDSNLDQVRVLKGHKANSANHLAEY
jgi:hypothetical protein